METFKGYMVLRMYIDYEKIGLTLRLFFPKYSKEIWDYCYRKKIEQNCDYIKRNKRNVIKKLKRKIKKSPLTVVFYIYEACRWKSQSLYDLMLQDERFNPIIVVTKINVAKNSNNYQVNDEVKKTFEFFKEKNTNVFYGYDLKNDKYIPLKKFNPDIIFYSHPWYIEKSQGPVICSKFALTYYVPYFLPNTTLWIEYDLRFHQYLHKHYVLNKKIKESYIEKQTYKSNNFVVAGHPQLDYFYLNNHKEKEKKYVIYAPHWSLREPASISYSTFEWSGKYVLEYAKAHSEINWLFKPHPLLQRQLLLKNSMTEEEIKDYWAEWDKIALKYEKGDYLDLFSESYAMITDCGSFLTEFLMTEQPVIHLVSDMAVEYNNSVKKIVKSYYQAHNIEELDRYLEEIILKKQDPKKEERLSVLEELGLKNNYCAKNILEDIIGDLSA